MRYRDVWESEQRVAAQYDDLSVAGNDVKGVVPLSRSVCDFDRFSMRLKVSISVT